MEAVFSLARRVGNAARSIAHELKGGLRLTADLPSFARFASDTLLSRLVGRVPVPMANRERSIRVHGDLRLHYRLNRGDLQSIREVWIDEVYRLPFEVAPNRIIDLGANIGLTSLWLAKRYGTSTIVAVEPSPENARLVRLNLDGNNIRAEILEAAVGPRDGTAYFADDDQSNLGHLAESGRAVQVLSMDSVLRSLPEGEQVDLVKMDIEGGEGPLMEENLAWLGRVRAIIAELHPAVIDMPRVIRSIESQGFRYLPAGSHGEFESMDAFVRDDSKRPAA